MKTEVPEKPLQETVTTDYSKCELVPEWLAVEEILKELEELLKQTMAQPLSRLLYSH
jgi:hypothetical protein